MSSKRILLGPVITEKMTRLTQEGKYAFQVALDANKVQIKRAVQERYPDVTVDSVHTMVVRDDASRQYTQSGVVEGNKSYWKKAIVKLSEGEIDFFEHI